MNTHPTSRTLKSITVETTVFQSGNSQAVRIPKEFQFHTKQVEIRREGKSLLLRPKASTAAEALADLPVLSDREVADLDKAMSSLDDLPDLDEPEQTQPKSPAAGRRKSR